MLDFHPPSARMAAMKSQSRILIAMLALLALTYAAYAPGLSGGFLFDDFVNLNAIGATGPVDDWPTFFRYITSGTADPTGRPLALLSFLVDSRDWPSDPAPFLRSNLILHLLNGTLLFLLLRMLGRYLDPNDQRADAAALLASGLWLLHPLFVSTTLYVVQREAMLPATFMLAGLLCYTHGRATYCRSHHASGTAWMVVGILGGTVLAVLCKANGILLPLLAGVLELTILRRQNQRISRDPRLRFLRWALLVLPSTAVLGYLISFLPKLTSVVAGRDWTIAERLMTQPRVLTDYLQLLLVPRSISTGLYNDAYPISTGWFTPASTLPCVLLILALPLIAWRIRARQPAIAAGILFFFVGNLLESSTIPLELYFEHRAYVPALLLFWPLARGLCGLNISAGWRGALALVLIAILAMTTFQRAQLWGQPEKLAALWARQNPESSRAQATIAMMDTSSGRPHLAMRRLGSVWRRKPDDLQIAFNYVNAACASRGLTAEESIALERALEGSATGLPLINGWLGKAIDIARSNQCRGLGLEQVELWLAAIELNPHAADSAMLSQDVEPLRAQLAIARRKPDAALRHFDRALLAFTTPDVAARQASLLASNGDYRQALLHLDTYEQLKSRVLPPSPGMPRIHAKVLQWQGYWPHEMAVLRGKLHDEINRQPADPSAAPKVQ